MIGILDTVKQLRLNVVKADDDAHALALLQQFAESGQDMTQRFISAYAVSLVAAGQKPALQAFNPLAVGTQIRVAQSRCGTHLDLLILNHEFHIVDKPHQCRFKFGPDVISFISNHCCVIGALQNLHEFAVGGCLGALERPS